MDAVKEDMQVVGVRLEDTEKRVKWKSCKEEKNEEEDEDVK